MFLNLAEIYRDRPGGLHNALTLPAAQLSRWLDEAWLTAGTQASGFAGAGPFSEDMSGIRATLAHPQPRGGLHGIAPSGINQDSVVRPAEFTLQQGPGFPPENDGSKDPPLIWQHLIYAYLIESTGAFDIMAEVSRRLVGGETLGVLSQDSIAWLRNTEELFFRDPPLFSVSGVVSDLRSSASVSRRNAYWRMFGMDLPHQIPAGWPGSRPADSWKTFAGSGVNTDFQDKLAELLRQVWVGIVNSKNTIGINSTDEAYIALLCTALRDMLHNRRQNGLLAREEFAYVAFLSWFHLTLLGSAGDTGANSPIIADLQSTGTAPEQRLNNLAQKVGMKPAARSRELFQLSELMSILLRNIELGVYDTPGQAAILFDGSDADVLQDMRTIINLWQSATGQRIKDAAATSAPAPGGQPIRIPTPTAGAVSARSPSSNGTSARV